MNSDNVLYNLAKHATDSEYGYERLYRNLYNREFYIKAYCNIYKNNGSSTKGVDTETADGFGDEKINTIIELMKTEEYQPKPVRRKIISKKKGGTRPLGIPSFTDRIVQEICRQMLEAIYEPTFSENSHGFRQNRSCHTALNDINMNFVGMTWFIEGDIKGFFDNIDHHVLIDILRKRIKDEKFIRLIWKFLRAGYVDNWIYHKTYSGTPQGGIISPILSNIYLGELDSYMKEYKERFDLGGDSERRKRSTVYRRVETKVSEASKRIRDMDKDDEARAEAIKQHKKIKLEMLKLPTRVINKNYKRIVYVRYADDFLIGIVGSKEDCQNVKNDITGMLRDKLKLELSQEKTFITHANKEARFLGYNITLNKSDLPIKDKNGILRRAYNKQLKFTMPNEVIQNEIIKRNMVKDMNAETWQPIHRPYLRNLSDLEIIKTYNAEIRGLYNYYKLAENISQKMGQYKYVMEYSCLKTLANKHKTSMTAMRIKLSEGEEWGIKYQTKTGQKTTLFYNEGFKRLNPKHVKHSCDDVDFTPNTLKLAGRTELERRINANRCEMCGAEGNDIHYEIHHINKIKNLRGKEDWEILMISRSRKTLVLCEACHKNIHKAR